VERNFRQLFVYWCAHLVERLVRFERYLIERTGDVPSQRRAKHNVIEDLRADIVAITKDLHEISRHIGRKSVVRDYDFLSITARVFPIVREITQAHHRLAYLPQPWAEPDTELLLKSVLAEHVNTSTMDKLVDDDSGMWTIVLTNEYNLSNIVVDKDSGTGKKTNSFPHVLSLPAIEKDTRPTYRA